MVKGFTPTPFPKTGNRQICLLSPLLPVRLVKKKKPKMDKYWKEVRESMFTVHIKKKKKKTQEMWIKLLDNK